MKTIEQVIFDWVSGQEEGVNYTHWLEDLRTCVRSKDFRPAKAAKEAIAKKYHPLIADLVNVWCNLVFKAYRFDAEDTHIIALMSEFCLSCPIALEEIGVTDRVVDYLNGFDKEEIYAITGMFFALLDIIGREKSLPVGLKSVYSALYTSNGFDWYILTLPVNEKVG